MLDKIKDKLKSAVNFPSPPAIAQRIIELASDPDSDVMKVAAAITQDPGLTAKILRIANSPLYSKQRKSENLRQALVVLGLNATITLALSFSLIRTFKAVKGQGIDYARYWRRAILSASAARAIGAVRGVVNLEELFLAALLQDIAVIALDRMQKDFYAGLPEHATHADIISHEVARLGVDHAELGGWLLEYWKLPESLCRAVAWSHTPPAAQMQAASSLAARCITLGSECAEILLDGNPSKDLTDLSTKAGAWLGMDPVALAETMAHVVLEVPEIERLFDTALLDADECAAIVEQARELLMLRNLQVIEQVNELQQSAEHFQALAASLEEKRRRDPLTGLFNRGHLDHVLRTEFQSAVAGQWPLSIVFVDLDRFKRVNDTHGHAAGDTVLVTTARLLQGEVRGTDCVGRYGGEEFVIVLPGLDAEGAQRVSQRLLSRLRETRYQFPSGPTIVTASLGVATHCNMTPFCSVAQLMEAADRSLYKAKQAGRNRVERYHLEASMAAT